MKYKLVLDHLTLCEGQTDKSLRMSLNTDDGAISFEIREENGMPVLKELYVKSVMKAVQDGENFVGVSIDHLG